MLGQGYECLTPPSTDESVVIMNSGATALTDKDIGALNDLVQSEVERYLVNISYIKYYCLMSSKPLSYYIIVPLIMNCQWFIQYTRYLIHDRLPLACCTNIHTLSR